MMDARRESWLRLWVDRCQCLVDRVGEVEPRILVANIRSLFADIPTTLSVDEQCLLRSRLGQLISRLLRVHKVDSQPDLGRAFLAFASTGLSADQWQRELADLLDQCDVVLATEPTSRSAHIQVVRALCGIQDRYSDPLLNLEAVAEEIGLSASHMTRLLKLHTGHGFLTHLHRRRSSVAHQLLLESHLSVKEIAAAVGYRSVTQLGRYFKRYCGSTPASIRSLVSVPLASQSAPADIGKNCTNFAEN